MSDYISPSVHDNAGAVFYNKKLWVFYSTEDSSNNEIHYRTYDGEMSDSTTLKGNGELVCSKAQTSPVVANKVLYLIFTGISGKVDFIYFDPMSNKWSSVKHVSSGVKTDARCAGVYNLLRQRLELFWTSESGAISYATVQIDQNGHPGALSQTKQLNTPLKADEDLSAVFFKTGDETGVTYLAFRSGTMGYVHHLQYGADATQDFTLQRTDSQSSWTSKSTGCGPTLADLGPDRLALIWKEKDGGKVHYQYCNKRKDAWESSVHTLDVEANDWSPTGAVAFLPDSSNSKKWVATFFLFYGYWGKGKTRSEFKMVNAATAGYWLDESQKDVDFSANEQEAFYTWPLVALVDCPPFVLNGNDPSTFLSRTKTSFVLEKETSQTFMVDLKGGPYVSSGPLSPVELELSTGLSGSYESGVTKTFKTTDTLTANIAGHVMGFFITPIFRTHTLRWYDASGARTDICAYPIEVKDCTLMKRVFDPKTGVEGCKNVALPYLAIPTHHSENDLDRIKTYADAEEGLSKLTSSCVSPSPITKTWTNSSPSEIELSVQTDEQLSVGAYLEFKIGAELEGVMGFGVSGSFELKMTSSVKQGVKIVIALENPDAKVSGDIDTLDVKAYWLKGASTSTWVPSGRKGCGDQPMFITYSAAYHQKP